MPTKKTPAKGRKAATVGATKPTTAAELGSALAWLEAHGSQAIRDQYGPRYGIHAPKAFGVSMANLKVLAKRLGRSHELAAALWKSGWYEARLLASMVEEPEQVTAAQMERWVEGFDNWGLCDTVCFVLFDRTPHAWDKVEAWSGKSAEFVKRTAFALLWSLALHDKKAADERFEHGLTLIEREAGDERNFVKKAVAMALKAIGKKRPALRGQALEVARRLAQSPPGAARWVGKDALRELGG